MQKNRRLSKVTIAPDSRVGTAQAMLHDFFEGGQFQALKEKNVHKFHKTAQGAPLIPSVCAPKPIMKTQQRLVKVPPPDAAPLRSALKTPGLGVGGTVHLGPLLVEDVHAVSDILHRVTLQPGGQPGNIRRAKTPKDPLSKAALMGELQLKNLLGSNSIKSVLEEVLEVHHEINEMAASMAHHRFALSQKLKDVNALNLKLFQRMMSEVLMLHRHKFQSQTDTVTALENANRDLDTQLTHQTEQAGTYRLRAERAEARVQELESLFRVRELEVDLLRNEVDKLQENRKDFIAALDEERKEVSRQAQAHRIDQAEMLRQEKKVLLDQRHEMQMQLLRQNAVHQDQLLVKEAQRQNVRNQLNELKAKQKDAVDADTQTEVDDFGVFDRREGWVLPISGTTAVRNRWRRGLRFAGCPHCKGIGKYVLQAAVHMKRLQRGELDRDEETKNFKSTGKWHIPDDMVQFMSNLPRSIESEKLWSVASTARFVWNLCDLKYNVDAEDAVYGYNTQRLPEFVIESFLLRARSRIEAERHMYLMLSSLKDHVMNRRHTLLHTFARFLGAMNTKPVEEFPIKTASRTAVNAAGLIKTSNCSLPASLLTVYLFARTCLLFPYIGQYNDGIQTSKKNSEALQQHQAELEKDENDAFAAWNIVVPDHVLVMDKFQLWIPLDRAVHVTKAILSFLSEKQMSIVFRHIEKNAMFLAPTGTLSDADGMHTVIRAWMRKFQAASAPSAKPVAEQVDVPMPQGSDRYTIVVNMEKILEAIIEMLLSRIRGVEEKLRKQFIEGDDNGDGVLNFQEFVEIVTKIAPHFPKRRILKMFREALIQGSDDDRINEKSFVNVCKMHGLAQLVDINSLKKNALAELTPVAAVRRRESTVGPSKLKRYANMIKLKQSKQKKTMAEVVSAAIIMNRTLRRQALTLKKKQEKDSEPLRRIASEELKPSSDEAVKNLYESMATTLRRTNSDSADRSSDHSADEIEETPLFPQRFSQFKKALGGGGHAMTLRRIDSQEEYSPDLHDEETFIQIHRKASKDITPLSARSNSSFGPLSSRKISIITNCSSGESETDEHGQIAPLGGMRRNVSVVSRASPTNTELPEKARNMTSSNSQITTDPIDEERSDSSSILFDADDMKEWDDDEPDLDDI